MLQFLILRLSLTVLALEIALYYSISTSYFYTKIHDHVNGYCSNKKKNPTQIAITF